MTDEQINIAIAEACGKTNIGNYCNDLNVMHEAEKTLNIDQQYSYGEMLRVVSENVGPRGGHFLPNGWGCFSLAHLTARQRAEAFVTAIGK